MEILFVLSISLRERGPSVHLLTDIMEGLLKKGYILYVLEIKNTESELPKRLTCMENFHCISIEHKNKERGFLKRFLAEINYSFKCKKYMSRYSHVDVVFLQSCNNAFMQIHFLKKIIHKPIIYNVQDIFPLNASFAGLIKKKTIIYKILELLQMYAYKQATKIVTISDDMKDTLIELGVTSTKIEVIYNWSYSDQRISIAESNNKFIEKYAIYNNRYKVVYAGNLGKMQNIEVILQAAEILKRHQDIEFYIIGEGVMKSSYQKDKDAKNLDNVHFYPMQEAELAESVYCMADINIIPLIKGGIQTALPSKTATCFRLNKPIITCIDINSKFAKSLIQCDNCIVVDSDDGESLAKSILQFKEGRVIHEESIPIYDYFLDNFSKEKNVNKYINIFKKTQEGHYESI